MSKADNIEKALEIFNEQIKDISDKIKQLKEEQIQEIKAMKDSKVWKQEYGESYWVIAPYGDICSVRWNNTNADRRAFEIGHCYKTREEAEEALEIKKIDTELRRYALEHNEEEIDWKNFDQKKYSLYYDYEDDEITAEWGKYYKEHEQICFTSREIAENAIEAIGRDRVEKWCKYE